MRSNSPTGFIPTLALRREICGANSTWGRHEKRIVDYRIRTLTASKFHAVSMKNDTGQSALAFDDAEKRFLLCGSSRGSVSIVDFDENVCEGAAHRTIEASKKNNHKHLITSCQWYPIDSGIFVTGSMDRKVKLWDANRLRAVEEFEFEFPVSQLHWSVGGNFSAAASSVIAVATSTSNVQLLDPLSGSSIHHLRCKGESINTVWWKRSSNFHLLTGSHSGSVMLWDIRSGKNELARLTVPSARKRKSGRMPSVGHGNPVICVKDTENAQKVVAMTLNKTLNVWDAQSLGFLNSAEVDHECIAQKVPLFFDVCNEGSTTWAFIPSDNNVIVQNVGGRVSGDDAGRRRRAVNAPVLPRNGHRTDNQKQVLQGHFSTVTACAYRHGYQQLVTASTDRLTLVWVPAMDERRPDSEATVSLLHRDEFSDDDD